MATKTSYKTKRKTILKVKETTSSPYSATLPEVSKPPCQTKTATHHKLIIGNCMSMDEIDKGVS